MKTALGSHPKGGNSSSADGQEHAAQDEGTLGVPRQPGPQHLLRLGAAALQPQEARTTRTLRLRRTGGSPACSLTKGTAVRASRGRR